MVVQLHAARLELGAQIGIQQAEVHALGEILLAGVVEDGVDHLVQHALLVEVGVAHELLEALVGARYPYGGAQGQCLGHSRRVACLRL